MSEPRSAAQRRPNDRPYYVKQTCDKCGADLVYANLVNKSDILVEEIWYDEFMCPNCRDGVYMDWPRGLRR